MSDAKALYSKEDLNKPAAYFCNSCKVIHRNESDANECCVCPDCGGKSLSRNNICGDCRVKKLEEMRRDSDERLINFLNKASRVSIADYPLEQVYDPTTDEYVLVDYLEERCIDEPFNVDSPMFGIYFGCKKNYARIICDNILIEAEDSLGCEDFEARWVDEDELREFIDRWNKKQEAVNYCYLPDYSVVIDISEESKLLINESEVE